VSAARRRWAVRLTAVAEADFAQVLRWTAAQFGARQAQVYARTLSLAIEALSQGPEVLDASAMDDIAPGLRALHVARSGRKGRHIVIFREQPGEEAAVVEVLRVLHDAMDLPRHLDP
jgi:toxin ParE1/3/4